MGNELDRQEKDNKDEPEEDNVSYSDQMGVFVEEALAAYHNHLKSQRENKDAQQPVPNVDETVGHQVGIEPPSRAVISKYCSHSSSELPYQK